MAKQQNFSVYQGSPSLITVTVDKAAPEDTLDDHTVEWNVYASDFGIPSSTVLISKNSSSPGGIEVLGSPEMTFVIQIDKDETSALLGNLYHKASVIDAGGGEVPVMEGLMTVLQAR